MVSRLIAAATSALVVCLAAVERPLAKDSSKPDTLGRAPLKVRIASDVLTHFRKDARAMPSVGKLTWLGGLVLTGDDRAFGGYSGLTVGPDGKRFLAVSDAGTWLTGELIYRRGRLSGIGDAKLGSLLALGGRQLRRRRDRDAESVRLASGSLTRGVAVIAFERNQRIGYFPVRSGTVLPPIRYLRPHVRLSANKGLEAVAVVPRPAGRRDIIAFAERAPDRHGHHRGFLWVNGRGRARPLALTNQDGFDITDMIALDDGRVLVLERRFRWSEGVRMRIREVAAERVRPGRLMVGRTLLRADLRYEIDNMEGMAAHQDARGRTILTLISDDNFNAFLQRTLILQFALAPPVAKAARQRLKQKNR